MKSLKGLHLLVLLLGATPLVACGGALASLQGSLSLWHQGQRGDAVTQTAVEYARFRDANDLDEARVQSWADALQRRVDEEPVVPRGEAGSPLPGQRIDHRPGALDRELRADLLGSQASRVARAIGVVRGLGLRQHASSLITLIYDRRVVAEDGAVLEGLDPAERSVTIKRMALDTLKGFK